MKTFFALLTLCSAALADLSTVEMNAIPVASDFDTLRDLKGSGKTSKSGSSTSSSCIVAPPVGQKITFNKAQVKEATETEVLTAWEADFTTSGGTPALIGKGYYTAITVSEGTCIQNLLLQFNRNTHLALSGACGQKLMAVTGGTGKYPCAQGQATVSGGKAPMITLTEVSCNC